MSDAELDELGNDIKASGLQAAVVFWQDGAGEWWLLDGRNRLDAVERAGLPTIARNGDNAPRAKSGSPLAGRIRIARSSAYETASGRAPERPSAPAPDRTSSCRTRWRSS
jgi:hypothetical protein